MNIKDEIFQVEYLDSETTEIGGELEILCFEDMDAEGEVVGNITFEARPEHNDKFHALIKELVDYIDYHRGQQ